MWTVLAIIFDPVSGQGQYSFSVGQRIHTDVVAFKRFHRGFGRAVGLGAFDGCEAGVQPQL